MMDATPRGEAQSVDALPAVSRVMSSPNTGGVKVLSKRQAPKGRSYQQALESSQLSSNDAAVGPILEDLRVGQDLLTKAVEQLTARAASTEAVLYTQGEDGTLINKVDAVRSLVRVMQPVVTHLTDSMVTQSQDLQRVVGTVQTVAGQVHRIDAAVTSLVDSQQAAQSQTDRLVAVSLQQAELIARLSNLALAGQPPSNN